MKSPLGSFLGLICTLTIVGSAVAFWIFQFSNQTKSTPVKSIPPATQTKAVKESDLNIVTLTPEAETRLAITTQPLTIKKIERMRMLGGEIVLPAGRSVNVTAPFVGTLKPVEGASLTPGKLVKKGQSLFTLVPLLTNEARTALATSLVDAEGQVNNTQVQVGAAAKALERARQLIESKAGSERAVDEAQAAFDLAQKTKEAAIARRDLIDQTIKGIDSGSVISLSIDSPSSGMVQAVHVASEQSVSAGTPLFEIVNHDVMWVRVPVYVGELNQIASDSSARLSRVGESSGTATQSIKPIGAPPSATAASATMDLYYELDNTKGIWVPGQRVTVSLPLREEDESLLIAWSAVVIDVNGDTWLYEQISPQNFVRRRVQVRRVVDSMAILSSGPKPGSNIVTQGVAELFGKEMGFGK